MSSSSCNIVIRADAGGQTGTGHVMRMMALAQALRERLADVIFVTASCPDALVERLREEEFEVVRIDGVSVGSIDDGVQASRIASAHGASWIIADGYAFGREFQSACRSSGTRLLCVDDHGYCDRWNVDALLNQNIHAAQCRNAFAQSAPNAALLLGRDFALLRKEFWRRPSPSNASERVRVLLTMGGADPQNASAVVVEALASLALPALKVTVLIGNANPHRANLEALCARDAHRFEILGGVDRMSPLLENHDAVITAGGSTCWEVLWAGTPAAVMVIAENQWPIAEALAQSGRMLMLGIYGELSVAQLADKLQSWVANLPNAARESAVDGKGARRVAAVLHGRYNITIATAGEGWLRSQMDSLGNALEAAGHHVTFATKLDEMSGGDFLLLLSYWGIVPPAVLDRYLHSLVVHASDLPNGRGWSPATWRILDGQSVLPICLLEAGEKVDRGDIYYRDEIRLAGHELISEWREHITRKTTELCLRFVNDYPRVLAMRESQPDKGTYCPRRTPADSRLDTSRTLEQLFNQLRVVDNAAYPAFFDHLGHRYFLKIEEASPS